MKANLGADNLYCKITDFTTWIDVLRQRMYKPLLTKNSTSNGHCQYVCPHIHVNISLTKYVC